MSEPSPPTLGSKIDALLTPFVEDEAKLQKRRGDIRDEAQRLEIEMQQIDEDLAVVESAKVDALRQAAESDPLLNAVFGHASAPKLVGGEDAQTNNADSDEPEIEVVEGDGHPLLSHAS